ncbi:hypothetical protein R6Q59_003822 [Mikania micrantha]
MKNTDDDNDDENKNIWYQIFDFKIDNDFPWTSCMKNIEQKDVRFVLSVTACFYNLLSNFLVHRLRGGSIAMGIGSKELNILWHYLWQCAIQRIKSTGEKGVVHDAYNFLYKTIGRLIKLKFSPLTRQFFTIPAPTLSPINLYTTTVLRAKRIEFSGFKLRGTTASSTPKDLQPIPERGVKTPGTTLIESESEFAKRYLYTFGGLEGFSKTKYFYPQMIELIVCNSDNNLEHRKKEQYLQHHIYQGIIGHYL